MSNLVQVPFHGDVLDAIVDDAGTPWISIRRVCDALGVSYSRQHKKLKEYEWASVALLATVAADGKSRPISCISLRSLPKWLGDIDPDRVSPELRPKILIYQRECADALYERFFGQRQATIVQSQSSFTLADLRACMGDMVRETVVETVTALVPQLLAAHNNRLATVEQKLAENLNAAGVIGYEPGKGICQRINKIVELRAFEGSGLKVKSERSRLHVLLRRHVNHHGPGAPWLMLPSSKLVEANHYLNDAEADAARVRKASGIEDKQGRLFQFPTANAERN